MSPNIDLYALLGVERDASSEDIHKAYQRLKRAHHPDKSPGKASAQYLKLIHFAYQRLARTEDRKLYDEFGTESLRIGFDAKRSRRNRHTGNYNDNHGAQSFRWQSSSVVPPSDSGVPSSHRIASDSLKPNSSSKNPSFRWLGDWVKPPSSQQPGSFSWLGQAPPPSSSGLPFAKDTPHSLGWLGADAPPFATQRSEPAGNPPRRYKKSKASTPKTKRTPRTQVSRSTHKAGRATAKAKRGNDRTTSVSLSFKQAIRGGTVTVPKGQGADEELSIETPAGLRSGDTLRVKGQGGAGKYGGPRGDLLLAITVREHRFFRRNGDDIHIDLPITLKEAVLGAQIVVPTPHGKVNLTIFPRTQTGKVLRLRGRGVHRAGQPAGDMYVRAMVIYPQGAPTAQLLQALPEQEDVRAAWP